MKPVNMIVLISIVIAVVPTLLIQLCIMEEEGRCLAQMARALEEEECGCLPEGAFLYCEAQVQEYYKWVPAPFILALIFAFISALYVQLMHGDEDEA